MAVGHKKTCPLIRRHFLSILLISSISAPVSGFGQTRWDVAEAAVFGAALPCRPGGATLLGTTGPALFESGLGSGSQTVVRDTAVVDGAVNGLGSGAVGLGERLRKLQNGHVRSYAALMSVGVVLVLAVVLVARI